MPTFEWEGRSLSGELKKGTLNVESAKDLRSLVRKDGIILTKASEKLGDGVVTSKGSSRTKVKKADVAVFTRQLSTMITSGLPLVQSLEILSGQLENPGR